MQYVLLALAGLHYKARQYEVSWQFTGEANRAAQEGCDQKGLLRCLFQSALLQIQQGLFARAQASLRACGEQASVVQTRDLEVLAWSALARLVASRPHLLRNRAFLAGSSPTLPGGQTFGNVQEPKVPGIVPGGFTVPAAPFLDHTAVAAHETLVTYHTLANQASFRSSCRTRTTCGAGSSSSSSSSGSSTLAATRMSTSYGANLLAGQSLVFCVSGQRALAEASARVAQRFHPGVCGGGGGRGPSSSTASNSREDAQLLSDQGASSTSTGRNENNNCCSQFLNSDQQRDAFGHCWRLGDFETCQELVKYTLEDRGVHLLQRARLSLARGDFVTVVDLLDSASTLLAKDMKRKSGIIIKFLKWKSVIMIIDFGLIKEILCGGNQEGDRLGGQSQPVAVGQYRSQPSIQFATIRERPMVQHGGSESSTKKSIRWSNAQKWRIDMRCKSNAAKPGVCKEESGRNGQKRPRDGLEEKRQAGYLLYRDHLTIQDITLAHTLIADAHLGCQFPVPAALACGRALLLAQRFGLQEARARALSRVACKYALAT
ncbi:unnamed protein product [Amoebophrya sp. A25]|nr:unnamed protein product [Amoebophrya sp. A25]|eukprot:GSA25T00025810001.1